MNYLKTEVAHLHVGDEFVDASDIPHRVLGFDFLTTPAQVIVKTDQRPQGLLLATTDKVWRAEPKLTVR